MTAVADASLDKRRRSRDRRRPSPPTHRHVPGASVDPLFRARAAGVRSVRACPARPDHRPAFPGRLAGAPGVRPRLLLEYRLEPGDGKIRRRGDDLRHAVHRPHRHHRRIADVVRHRFLPHRDRAAQIAPADRHGDPASRGGALHHLRHVGLLRRRAADRHLPPAAADRSIRACPPPRASCSRGRRSARAC